MPQPVDPILIAQGIISRLEGDDPSLRNYALKIAQEYFQWVDSKSYYNGLNNLSGPSGHSNLARSSAGYHV